MVNCIKFKENLLDPSTLRGFLISQCLPYPKKFCPFYNLSIFKPAIGELDPDFGDNGIVKLSIATGNNHYTKSMALQSDGKIVVAGYFNNGTNDDVLIIRYNTDGTLDSTFSGGYVIKNFGDNDQANSIAIQSDGKIVVAGYFNNGTNDDVFIVRYNTDGTLDSTFSGGYVIKNFGDNDQANSIAIQSDGKIVVAGYFNNGTNNDIFIVRYNTDGTPDNTFAADGILERNIGTDYDYSASMAIQSDGKILVQGYFTIGTNNDIFVLQCNSNGILDNTFAGDGILEQNIGTETNTYDSASSIAIQPDGKIVVAGYYYNGSNNDIFILRYNTNGTLDNSFAGDGILELNIGSIYDQVTSVVVQPDGKIIVAGQYYTNDSYYDIVLLRFR